MVIHDTNLHTIYDLKWDIFIMLLITVIINVVNQISRAFVGNISVEGYDSTNLKKVLGMLVKSCVTTSWTKPQECSKAETKWW